MTASHDGRADVLWFLPTHGDGRYLGAQEGARDVSLGYLQQIAQGADALGYYGVLLPTGRSCEDSWIVASALAPLTRQLRFLVAVRPGLMEPSAAARMTATLDRISGGRLLINVVTGGDPVELAGDGVFLSHDERYAVTDEFLTIWRGLLAGETVTFQGAHLRAENGRLIPSRLYTVNQHDILTGSKADGTAFGPEKDMTCGNWTKSGEGNAMLGHADRMGLRDDDASKSWNASHPSRACDAASLVATGGAGLLYCFAAN